MNKMDEPEKKGTQTEKQSPFHLLVVGIYTVFSLLLVVATLLQSWEKWTIPLILLSIAAVWVIYVGQFWTRPRQVTFYTILMLLEFFIYGAHPETFFDLPLVMCLLILILLSFRQMEFIYIAAGTYGAVLLYHICFLGTLKSGEGWSATRVFLGLAAVISCVLLCKLLLEQRQSERKQSDKALRTMEAANRRSEDFLANVSHELRTPINAVTGVSDILLQKELQPELREDVLSIQQAGRRLAVEINNILDYTDLTAGRLSTSNEDYLVSSSINDMVVMAAAQNEGRGLELVFDVDAGIPSVLIGDEAKIRRVMNIILENAIKFTEAGGVYVSVGCRKAPYGINLNLQIQDTGIGMSAAQQSQIYHQFYQADSGRDRKSGGLGLGLPIAHGLVHAMGGFMNILSEEDKGTRVQITIPQGVGDESPCIALHNPASRNVLCYFGLEPYSGEVREFYKRALKHFGKGLGANVRTVYQVSEFRELLHTFQPTHVFVTQEEYSAHPDFYKEVGQSVFVTVIATGGFALPQDSGPLFLLHKPFCAFPMVSILNESEYRANSDYSVNSSEGISCEGVKILVVDDDEMNLLVARGIFSSYGMEVDTCLGGEAALEQCAQVVYDAVFLDHMMPGMDGIETLKRLRVMESGLYQTVPIVALTANAVSGAREMFKSEGFDEFVAKPIERSVLERVLRRILPGKWKRVRVGETGSTPAPQKTNREEVAAPSVPEAPAPQNVPEERPAMQDAPQEPEQPAVPDTSQEPEQPAASPLAVLGSQGFDVKTGISYCADNEEFYLDMLRNFHTTGEAKQTEIASFHKAGDWENYTIKVHALKSSARTIGAMELSSCAAGLEQAGKSGDMAYMKENHPKLMSLYETCRTQIGVCLGMAEEESQPGEMEEVPEETWQNALNDLAAAVKAFNGFPAKTVIEELSGYARHGKPCGDLFQALAGYIDDYDFEAADEELRRLSEEEGAL